MPSRRLFSAPLFASLRASPFVLAAAALGGCVATEDYPSLAVRPAERVSGSMTPVTGDAAAVPAPLPVSVNAPLNARLAALVGAARASNRAFAALQTEAQRAAAAGGAGDPFGRAHLSAEVALSRLQVGRSGTLAALAELDELYADARNAEPLADTPDLAAIARARDEVEDMARGQDAALDALASRIDG